MLWYSPVHRLHVPVLGNIWGHIVRAGKLFAKYYDANPFLTGYRINGTGSLNYHTGADINAKNNADFHEPVFSIRDNGLVTGVVDLGKSWGPVVIVCYEADNIFARYAHVENIVVRTGQTVMAGEQIASTGDARGFYHKIYAHLHFDISPTDILRTHPGHWPFANKSELLKHYVDPARFLLYQGNSPARAIINTAALRIREQPSIDSAVVGRLLYGQIVDIKPTYEGKWVKLVNDKGYIHIDYIKRLP